MSRASATRLRRLLLLAALLPFMFQPAATAAKKAGGKQTRQKDEEPKGNPVTAAQFTFGFNDLHDLLVIVASDTDRGKCVGSGFIAEMDGKRYIVTNQHVILGGDATVFKTISGRQLVPRGVELSTTRDIARLEIDADSGLEVADAVKMGMPVGVFGNSEGAGVATELYGTVNGVGADVVEVTADFVKGNSGSPVLNADRQVVGIASYLRYSSKQKDTEGTKFENSTRRFCYRLAGNEWQPVDWRAYNAKYGKIYASSDALVDSIFDIIQAWFKSPYAKVSCEDHPDLDLRKWSTDHNLMVNRITRLRDKGRATSNELNNTNKLIRKDICDSARALAAVCDKRAKQMRLFSQQRELTAFLRDRFEQYAGAFEYASDAIGKLGARLSGLDFFHFKEDGE